MIKTNIAPRAYALKRPLKTMTTMTAASRPKLWRNDITGLRALAVLPVLIFHAFPSLIPGGFFGVDVFFVISGYLISGIIFRGIASSSFSYLDFYEKRIKRIIPNLILLLTFVAAAGWFILLPDEYANLGMHIDASTLFIQNFQLLSEIGYFTEDALRKPLLHLWSLAIEEQFYIVFPLICTLIWRLSRSVKMIGIAAALIALGSLAACLSSSDRNFAFYFPLTRFWELGAGILLSYSETFIGFSTSRFSQNVRNGLSIAGILMIVLPMAFVTESTAHPGLNADSGSRRRSGHRGRTRCPFQPYASLLASDDLCWANQLFTLSLALAALGLSLYRRAGCNALRIDCRIGAEFCHCRTRIFLCRKSYSPMPQFRQSCSSPIGWLSLNAGTRRDYSPN